MITFLRTAFKHGITQEQMDDVLRSNFTEVFDTAFDKSGHYSAMYIGFDSNGVLLEIKVKFIPRPDVEDDVHIFHADKATKGQQQLFNERKKHEAVKTPK